jgi:cellobiose phosphorylase
MRLGENVLVNRPIEAVFTWITQPEHVVHWLQSRLDVVEGETVQPVRSSAGEILDISAIPLHKGAFSIHHSKRSGYNTFACNHGGLRRVIRS